MTNGVKCTAMKDFLLQTAVHCEAISRRCTDLTAAGELRALAGEIRRKVTTMDLQPKGRLREDPGGRQ
jgi:hypothetical protein